MRCLIHNFLIVGALTLLSACEGSTSGECRVIASHYTKTDTSNSSTTTSTSDVTCTFDRVTLTLSCTTVPVSGGTASSSTTTWASMDDFVAHHHPIGRLTYAQSSSTTGTCAFSSALVRDAMGRPVSQTSTATPVSSCGSYNLAYAAWDDIGRPVQGIRSGVGSSAKCVDQPVTWAYDDTALTITFQAEAVTGCSEFSTVTTFDVNSDPISSANTDSNGTRLSTYTILDTTSICR